MKVTAFLFAVSAGLVSCGPPPPEPMQNQMQEEEPLRSVNDLGDALASADWQVRADAVLAIQNQKESQFKDQLVTLLQSDSSAAVRQIAALALADFGDKRALPIIVKLLAQPKFAPDAAVDPTYMLDAIYRLPASAGNVQAAKVVASYLIDDDLNRRLYAVRALEVIQSGGSTVLALANRNQDSDKARAIVMALGKLQYKPAESYLKQQLHSTAEPTRAAAILALGRIGSESSIPQLTQILDSDFVKGRENAKEALLTIAKPGTANPMLPLLRSNRDETRYYAAEIAGRLPAKDTGEKLLSMFNENDKISSAPAATALGYMKYEPARPAIEKRLSDKSSPERERLAQSLGWIGNQKSIQPLITVLRESDGEGRYGAAWSLGILEAKEALPDLEKAAKSSDSRLASLAIEAIGAIADPSSLPLLVSRANDASLQVYAIDAIGRIGTTEAITELQKLATGRNEKTQALAVQSLGNMSSLKNNQTLTDQAVDALIATLRQTSTETPLAGQIYAALHRLTGESHTTKYQWLKWAESRADKH